MIGAVFADNLLYSLSTISIDLLEGLFGGIVQIISVDVIASGVINNFPSNKQYTSGT